MQRLFFSKKGFIGLWADVFKGFITGLIFGIILMILLVLEVIPFPISFCG
ncbi:hypothetical protein HZC31_00415 [Candidatus Woesearchaeota archaeon]|nr:hypothetical protein [Candidatus Woesearchaeota archaeon]